MTENDLTDEQEQLIVALDKRMDRFFRDVVWPHNTTTAADLGASETTTLKMLWSHLTFHLYASGVEHEDLMEMGERLRPRQAEDKLSKGMKIETEADAEEAIRQIREMVQRQLEKNRRDADTATKEV